MDVVAPMDDLVAHWRELLPKFVRRVLHASAPPHGVEVGALPHVASFVAAQDAPIPAEAPYDIVAFWELPSGVDVLSADLRGLTPHLAVNGFLVFRLHLPSNAPPPFPLEQFFPALDQAGFFPYAWRPKDRAGDLARGCLLMAARNGYNPMAHAQVEAEAGRPQNAVDIINRIDPSLFPDNQTLARAMTQKQGYFLQWLRQQPPPGPGLHSAHFAMAQKLFCNATYLTPLEPALWRNQGRILQQMGGAYLASRMLRSFLHVQDDAECRAVLEDCGAEPEQRPPEERSGLWTEPARPPRVLIIMHDYSDYGMDTLYDGLCIALGADNVVEYPWKATLHGRDAESALNYPCVFDYPGEPRTVEELEAALRKGAFDLILYADVVQLSRRDEVRRLLAAAPATPVVVYDTWDTPQQHLPFVLDYLGRKRVSAYFKREMLAHLDYGPDSHPLPFGYPDRLAPSNVDGERTEELFWAGKWLFGLRPLYLPHLQRALGRALAEAAYSQQEYRAALLRSRAGLSLFGFGYDTVRYWELPAHGCLLIAERPPIRIPDNFEDGRSALFFDTLPELEDKLAWVREHPDEVADIAREGRDRFLRFHTASQRARQFLAALQAMGLPGFGSF